MRLTIVALLVVVFIFSGAIAADFFTVDGIKTSSSGANGKQAKDSAIRAGQKEAFSRLLERISSGQENSGILNIDADKLSELVQGIEVNDEKITASYYSATINISFNKALVEKLLQEHKINFTNKKSAPIVLVPLLISDGQKMLFEEENPLRKSLSAVTSANHVLTIIVPANLRGIDKTKLNHGIEDLPVDVKDSLLKMGQNYKADKLILIAAEKFEGGDLNIRLQDIKDQASSIKEFSFKANDADAGEDVFTYAARGITSMLEGQWVRGERSDNASLSKITLTVPIRNLDEWVVMRRKLDNLSVLKVVVVKSVTVESALVEVVSSETFEILSVKMRDNGLFLKKTGDIFILTSRDINEETTGDQHDLQR